MKKEVEVGVVVLVIIGTGLYLASRKQATSAKSLKVIVMGES